MKKKNLSLMCAAMLAATAIPANFAWQMRQKMQKI